MTKENKNQNQGISSIARIEKQLKHFAKAFQKSKFLGLKAQLFQQNFNSFKS